MLRRLLDASAADIAGLAATILLVVVTFLMSRLMGIERDPPGHPPATEGREKQPHGSNDADDSEGAAVATTNAGSGGGRGTDQARHDIRAHGKTYNVILITVDTLRADLGFAGYPRPVSPNIDALAARSVVFEHAYAMASFTPKCLGPLLIGRYIGETKRDYEHYTHFFPDNVFVGERIQAGGGRTFGAASHRYFGWKKGFDQGFDVWDTSAIPPNSTDNDPTPTSAKLTDVAIAQLSSPHATELPLRAPASAKAREGKAKSHFFAWVHYLDPHLPYVAHEGAPSFAAIAGGQPIPKERAPYDGEVWFTDQHVGRLLTHIAAQPWANETVIIFTADHGEAFGEHGHWGHGRELWEPLVHVPMLIYAPGAPAHRIKTKRSHIDVVPTILDLMGLPIDPELKGKSLVADLTAPADKLEERDVFIDMPEGPYNDMRRAIITGRSPGLKLIDSGPGKHQLFDLATDPNELKNLASDTGRLREAQTALSRVRASIKELPPVK